MEWKLLFCLRAASCEALTIRNDRWLIATTTSDIGPTFPTFRVTHTVWIFDLRGEVELRSLSAESAQYVVDKTLHFYDRDGPRTHFDMETGALTPLEPWWPHKHRPNAFACQAGCLLTRQVPGDPITQIWQPWRQPEPIKELDCGLWTRARRIGNHMVFADEGEITILPLANFLK